MHGGFLVNITIHAWCIRRVGQNHTFIGIHGIHAVFLAGKSPNIRSYAVHIYGSDQPLIYTVFMRNLFMSKLERSR